MLLAGKGVHVDTYLGDDGLGDPHTDSQDFIEQFCLPLEGGHVGGYLFAERNDRFVEEVDMSKDGSEEQTVVRCETALKRLSQLWKFLPEYPLARSARTSGSVVPSRRDLTAWERSQSDMTIRSPLVVPKVFTCLSTDPR
jgi:hypothetical protein